MQIKRSLDDKETIIPEVDSVARRLRRPGLSACDREYLGQVLPVVISFGWKDRAKPDHIGRGVGRNAEWFDRPADWSGADLLCPIDRLGALIHDLAKCHRALVFCCNPRDHARHADMAVEPYVEWYSTLCPCSLLSPSLNGDPPARIAGP